MLDLWASETTRETTRGFCFGIVLLLGGMELSSFGGPTHGDHAPLGAVLGRDVVESSFGVGGRNIHSNMLVLSH